MLDIEAVQLADVVIMSDNIAEFLDVRSADGCVWFRIVTPNGVRFPTPGMFLTADQVCEKAKTRLSAILVSMANEDTLI